MSKADQWIQEAWACFVLLVVVTYGAQHLVSGYLPQTLVQISLRFYAVLFALSCIMAAVRVMHSHSGEGKK